MLGLGFTWANAGKPIRALAVATPRKLVSFFNELMDFNLVISDSLMFCKEDANLYVIV